MIWRPSRSRKRLDCTTVARSTSRLGSSRTNTLRPPSAGREAALAPGAAAHNPLAPAERGPAGTRLEQLGANAEQLRLDVRAGIDHRAAGQRRDAAAVRPEVGRDRLGVRADHVDVREL